MTGVLPDGLASLHYQGCGCPPGWAASLGTDAAVHNRPADVVDTLVQGAFRTFQQGGLTPTRKLRIVYMLPHHNITGGMKCLVEHIRLLRERGHTTIAVHRSDVAQQAMPPWTTVKADVDIVCRVHERLGDIYNVREIDVCVVGIFHQVSELLMGVPAPVLYWEQGHEWLFGDTIRFQEAHNYNKQDRLFHMVMHLPCAVASVSEAVQAILSSEFGRNPLIIPNGIDCLRFTPGGFASQSPTRTLVCEGPAQVLPRTSRQLQLQQQQRRVLLVGNPALPLKAFGVALSALAIVNEVVPLRVTWLCQVEPAVAQLPVLANCGLTLDLHVSPPQADLPALYRGHDVLLFTSRYEAWGMPVLEGFASGLAVVATRCLGIASFAEHEQNCLLADPGHVMGLAEAMVMLLFDDKLRLRLALQGRLTALQFTPEAIVHRLEAVLYSLTAVTREVLALRQPALEQVQVAAAWASTACSKISAAHPKQPRAEPKSPRPAGQANSQQPPAASTSRVSEMPAQHVHTGQQGTNLRSSGPIAAGNPQQPSATSSSTVSEAPTRHVPTMQHGTDSRSSGPTATDNLQQPPTASSFMVSETPSKHGPKMQQEAERSPGGPGAGNLQQPPAAASSAVSEAPTQHAPRMQQGTESRSLGPSGPGNPPQPPAASSSTFSEVPTQDVPTMQQGADSRCWGPIEHSSNLPQLPPASSSPSTPGRPRAQVAIAATSEDGRAGDRQRYTGIILKPTGNRLGGSSPAHSLSPLQPTPPQKQHEQQAGISQHGSPNVGFQLAPQEQVASIQAAADILSPKPRTRRSPRRPRSNGSTAEFIMDSAESRRDGGHRTRP